MFLPYGTQMIDETDVQSVLEVLRSPFLTQGPRVEAFERAVAGRVGAKFCVAFCNATSALHCAVRALGVEAGAEGITSPNTFVASANCMAYCGVTPVFADIDPRTYNVTAETIAERVTEKTRLVIPVHFAGQPCDMSAIGALAKSRGLRVIEDAAHAIGSLYDDGSPVGNCRHSDITVFSFHPVKTVTCAEGGVATTNDPELYRSLCLFRSHGITKDPVQMTRQSPGPWYYEMQELGYNYRMTELQAALGLSQLKRLDFFRARRREIVARYNAAFAGLPNVRTPYEAPGVSSCFHLYVPRFDFKSMGIARAEFGKRLHSFEVGWQVLYIPVYTQPWYERTFGVRRGLCPNVEAYYEEALALPLYPKLTDDDVERVVKAVMSSIGGA
jgi:UDP-4-amino-4,6-dideoxy-N-acetyl-beta-L-altrosamine transaminase